jgi:hypothetical protein
MVVEDVSQWLIVPYKNDNMNGADLSDWNVSGIDN